MPLEVSYNETGADSTEAGKMADVMQREAAWNSYVTKKGVEKRQV